MKSEGKKRIAAILGLIAILAGSIFAASYFFRIIKRESSVLAEAKTKISNLEKKDREFADASRAVDENVETIELAKKAFLSDSSFVPFLEELENLAKTAGVSFEAQSADFAAPLDKPAKFNFVLDGRFEDIIKYLMLLDHIPQAGFVTRLSISPKDGTRVTVSADYLIFNRRPSDI
ncbi:hypothetical protein HYT01_01535 [Candidatus Giovannonibacteria bacterium]|nr:hypothetical protein [Candidatus Giovannonibacteria bacterium]